MAGGGIGRMEPRPERIVSQDQEYAPTLRLRAWREHRTLSQAELANSAGVARRTIVAPERTGRRAHPATIRALAAALGITTEQLRRDPPT
jgi:transcriptional regulator with XRE-family HTH domain